MSFAVLMLACLVLPPLASRLLRLDGWMPLVFVQLLLGMAATASGLTDALGDQGIDMQTGPLAAALRNLGWLGVCLLVALGATAATGEPEEGSPERRDWRFVPISIAGFAFTGLVGSVLGWALAGAEPSLIGPNSSRGCFAAAIGLLLSVTALPVLMAILAQMGMAETALGRLAARCASLDDLWLWLLMGGVLACSAGAAAATADSNHAAQPLLAGLAFVAFIALLWCAVRPLLQRWSARRAAASAGERALLSLAVIVLCAATTHTIGLHAVLGAFIGGAVLPQALLRGWRKPVLALNGRLLLPFYFVLSGAAIHIDAADAGFWALSLALTGVATLAKFGSVAGVARACGLPWREAFTLGSLMQCKGLMELVAVGVLQQAGVIDARIASALAAMAVISTLITGPAVRALAALRSDVGSSPPVGSTIRDLVPAPRPAPYRNPEA